MGLEKHLSSSQNQRRALSSDKPGQAEPGQARAFVGAFAVKKRVCIPFVRRKGRQR